MIDNGTLSAAFSALKTKSPLVHNITNFVVMNNTANALLAAGASPVMAHAVEEVAQMTSISSALVINIGTLSSQWVDAMIIAGKTANEKGVPVVFDPVGVGATDYRKQTCKKLLSEFHPDIIRGNASEIISLCDGNASTKGVDSTASSNSAIEFAKAAALQYHCIVSVSGPTDYITDGNLVYAVENGSEMMPMVTGLGCTASALTGAVAGVCKNYLEAALLAMIINGVAGEMADRKSEGPGDFQVNFINALYLLSSDVLLQKADYKLL